MIMSIEELRATASNMRKSGLNSQQIADELSLSQDTIAWLLAGDSNEAPSDVRIGWRTIGVKPSRMEAIGSIMADIADEEVGAENISTTVGISINGILFAQVVSSYLDSEIAIHRNIDGAPGAGSLSKKYGQVQGKKVIIVDDVLSSGVTMTKTIQTMRELGAEPVLAIVLVNKTTRNEIDGVPLRGVIRAVPV